MRYEFLRKLLNAGVFLSVISAFVYAMLYPEWFTELLSSDSKSGGFAGVVVGDKSRSSGVPKMPLGLQIILGAFLGFFVMRLVILPLFSYVFGLAQDKHTGDDSETAVSSLNVGDDVNNQFQSMVGNIMRSSEFLDIYSPNAILHSYIDMLVKPDELLARAKKMKENNDKVDAAFAKIEELGIPDVDEALSLLKNQRHKIIENTPLYHTIFSKQVWDREEVNLDDVERLRNHAEVWLIQHGVIPSKGLSQDPQNFDECEEVIEEIIKYTNKTLFLMAQYLEEGKILDAILTHDGYFAFIKEADRILEGVDKKIQSLDLNEKQLERWDHLIQILENVRKTPEINTNMAKVMKVLSSGVTFEVLAANTQDELMDKMAKVIKNARKLGKRKSQISRKSMGSLYSSDSEYTVTDEDEE